MGSLTQTFKLVTTKSMAVRKICLLAIVGTAISAPVPQAPYAAPVPVYAEEPPVYNYQYGVSDDYSGSKFSAQENRNNYDTAGEYRVNLPGGRTQIVSYNSGPEGYVADVKYEGEAVFPEVKPYVPVAAPAYKPASVVKVAAAPVVKVAPVAVNRTYAPAPVVVDKPVVHAPVYHRAPVVYAKPSGYVASPINPVYTPKKYGFTVREDEAPAAKEAPEEAAAEEEAPAEETPKENATEDA